MKTWHFMYMRNKKMIADVFQAAENEALAKQLAYDWGKCMKFDKVLVVESFTAKEYKG